MTQIDTTFVVGIIRSHVIRTDRIVDAMTWPAHRCHDVITRLKFFNIRPDRFDLSEALMANCQEIESCWRLTILRSINFLVRSINTNAKNFYKNSTTIWNL